MTKYALNATKNEPNFRRKTQQIAFIIYTLFVVNLQIAEQHNFCIVCKNGTVCGNLKHKSDILNDNAHKETVCHLFRFLPKAFFLRPYSHTVNK